ncbi:MAG: DegT/DnrJ/EryC1/StrS family aminotransferase [Actinomycetota bacterium]|jgi:arginine decarboxylase|nr:DegT/DnrJ/EryC1/StrS family aminotransferase [Actinomycetota bacterium]MDA2948653.1 DegT/DnrJ/EryC1/StrS family aminotransferase [Actinomycetota bacterium]
MGDTPLYDAYRTFLADPGTPFCTPGHKRNPDLIDEFLALDVPHYLGVENRRVSTRRLATAERLAGELWGADWCGFSVQGSTHGNEAICLTVGKPGDTVIVARTIHKSLFFGLVLAGLVPVWVRPDIDPQTGLTAGMPVERVAAALDAHPEAKAVMLVEPSYVGGVSDVAAHAELAHAHGIPLTVDAAWGAHLGFHPKLPPNAIAAGADVLVTSIHKHVTGFTQSSMVLAQGQRIDLERLEAAFEGLHTTSPSGSIFASIDRTRDLLAERGEELLDQAIRLADEARQRFRQVPGLGVVGQEIADRSPGLLMQDPTKIVLTLAGTGADGQQVADLLEENGLRLEFADRDTFCPVITLADTPDTVDFMVTEIIRGIEGHRGPPREVVPITAWTLEPDTAMSPRDAFFADHERVPAAEAVGRIAAETAAPYPPGVPALAPGERIHAATLAALQAEAASGTRIAYCGDPSLQTVLVVSE